MDWQVVEIEGNKEISLRVHHILAYGCSHRWMFIYLDDNYIVPVHIPQKLYNYLRSKGVPAAQSLRGKK